MPPSSTTTIQQVLVFILHFSVISRCARHSRYPCSSLRWMRRLSALVVVTDADLALAAEALRPEAAELNVALRHALVGEQEPGTEDRLGEDVKDGVGDDLLVRVHVAGAVSNTPDDGVDGPDDEDEATNGSEEVADLATLVHGHAAAVVGELPDNDEVSNAGNGVPAPLLRGALSAVGGEETSQDHDQISDDGDQDAAAVHASEQAQVEQQERGGNGPVDVTGVVDLTVDVVGGVRDVLVIVMRVVIT